MIGLLDGQPVELVDPYTVRRIRLPLVSNSSLTTARRCFREYYFRYVLMRKTRRIVEALRFGGFFHVGLNAWWRCEDPDPVAKLVAAFAAIHARAADPEQEGDADPFELVKAEELLTGYTARWGDEGYTTIAVEKMFRLPLVAPRDSHGWFGCPDDLREEARTFDIGGAIDAVASRGGVVRNVEHKTTASDISPGAPYWRHVVALDSQVSTYMAAARALGYDPRDTLYDAIRKPDLKPLKATPEASKKYTKPTKAEPVPRLYASMREEDETPEEYRERLRTEIADNPEKYFQRMGIVRLERDDEEHARDVWQTSEMIRFATERDAWPRSPSSCERYGRACDYHDVCSGTASIDDEARFKTKTRQHEELTEST